MTTHAEWTVAIVGYALTWLAIPHVLLAGKRPAATLAWVWSILLFPYLGAIAYFAFGADRMKRRRLRRISKRAIPSHGQSPRASSALEAAAPPIRALLRGLVNINRIPLSTADHVNLLVDAAEFYPRLSEAIRQAHHHVHIEFFIWRNDQRGREFVELLAAAARRGVVVRLLLDQIGCIGVSRRFFQPLVDAGGKFSWFYPLPFGRQLRFVNLRNHRKLQIIDGAIAFVGGMNIGEEYARPREHADYWRDAQIELRGNVVVHLQEAFATDWLFATEERIEAPEFYPDHEAHGDHLCQVIAGGPDLPREPIPKSLVALLNAAERRVWIATGYFVPDILVLAALQLCAARGVEVRLLISGKSDHPLLVKVSRSYYEELLRFGVRVFEYSVGINHAKTILVDDDWLMVGSANSDNRSMRLNFELNVLVQAPRAARELETMLGEDFEASREITLFDFLHRPLRRRLIEAALRPFAPLL
ncbi:MAG: cardiolipin synthase [Chthoniobacteraceae bacterium]